MDLWGGVADEATEQPWDEDTIVVVFSTTKGATAICANRLAQEGRLDVDAPVADYWPEFAQAGKESIPVDYLLSHRAGLAWVDEPLTLEEALAWDPMIHALEHQAPVWEPGTAARLPRGDLRLPRRRGRPARHRPHASAPTSATRSPTRSASTSGSACPRRVEPRVSPLIGSGFGLGDGSRHRGRGSRGAGRARWRSIGPESKLGKALSGGGVVRGRGHLQHPRGARGRDPGRRRHRRRALARPHVRGVRRRGRRDPAAHARAGGRRDDATQRGPGHRDPRPRPAVRARASSSRRACCSSAARSRSATSAWAGRPAGPTPRPSSGSAT